MSTGAGIEGELRKSLWAEAGSTAINLMNIQVSDKKEKTPYVKFSKNKKLPRYATNMRPFGEIGIILKSGKMKSKISDRGQRAIMVGYGIQNGNEVYRMYKPDTKKVTLTRNVRWTEKLFGDSVMNDESDDSISDSESEKSSDREEDEESDDSQQKTKTETSTKVYNALKQLHTSYNPMLNTLSALVYEDDIAFIGGTDETHVNPVTFEDVWDHPTADEQAALRTASWKEFRDMIDRKVWRRAKANEIPENRELIGTKWVF